MFLTRSINNGFEKKNEMSVTQRQGVITCIPKEGKDKSFIKNWRPITLLNTVYKIASSCIANRIQRVLQQLIGDQQTCFLQGRLMGDNLRLLYAHNVMPRCKLLFWANVFQHYKKFCDTYTTPPKPFVMLFPKIYTLMYIYVGTIK